MNDDSRISETSRSVRSKPYLIGISGGSASGKTSVAEMIFKLMGIEDCILISLDSYYKVITPEHYANLSEYNFDHPNAFDFDLVVEHLNDLLNLKEIEMPVYNFTVSRREKYTINVKPSNLIIFEGILALYDKRVRNLMDMKIFVDTDSDIRLARRVYRDIKERGRNLQNVILRYHKFVKPAFDEYIKPTIKMADVVIPRGAENTVAVDLVSQHLKYQLSKIIGGSSRDLGSVKSIEIFNHEIVDPKYQFSEGKINVFEDSTQVELLKEIFSDFINGSNIPYYKIFMEKMIDSLLSLYTNSSGDIQNTFVSEIDNVYNLDANTKNLVVFKHYVISESDVVYFEKILEQYKATELVILTTFLSSKFADILLTNNPNRNIKFYCLYYSDFLLKYQKYIQRGGLVNSQKDDDDYLGSELTVFKSDNFAENFKIQWKSKFSV